MVQLKSNFNSTKVISAIPGVNMGGGNTYRHQIFRQPTPSPSTNYPKQIFRQHLMIKEHMQLTHAKQHAVHAENPQSKDGESKSSV